MGTLARLKLTFRPDEMYRAPTDDGAAIALGRYHPRGIRRFQEPVMLGHGLGANRFSLDFNERYSLARYLAREGYETWVLELRGRGLAGVAAECTFDDQAEHDVRAALRVVRSTGAPKVSWVGHSKGGLAVLAHLAKNPEAPIQAGVAIGTPLSFHFQPGLKRFVEAMRPMFNLKVIPTGRLSHLALFGTPPGAVGRYLVNGANLDPDVAKAALENLSSDIAGGVARQLASWVAADQFRSADQSFDYGANLARVRVPFLLIAGSEDLMAPPDAVARGSTLLGGPTEGYVAEGFGHADLLIGRGAPESIFPRIEAFLARHSTPA